MGYSAPAAPVSADYNNHKNRNPPSSEPGTDYALAYGAKLYAPSSGRVLEIKTSNSGGMGRYVAIAFDDGRSFRHIHMSRVDINTNTPVAKGTYLGLSGASGNGSDYYYGPHVHSSLWQSAYWNSPLIDFQLYVGPDEEDDDMPLSQDDINKVAQAVWAYHKLAESTGSASAKAVLAQTWERAGKAASRSQDILNQMPKE